MKHRGAKTFFLLIFGMAPWVFLLGCQNPRVIVANQPVYRAAPPGPPPWAPAHGYRAKHHYRYYPSSYVYFDGGRGLYFYYDGSRWRASVSLPVWIHIDINEYVTLDMDTARPYDYHREVMEKYPPGHLKKKSKGKRKWKKKA